MTHAAIVIGLLSLAAIELVVIAVLVDRNQALRNELDDMRKARTR